MLEHGGTEDEAIAALLHDAVEDQGGNLTAMTIADRFGFEVARVVVSCTDTEVQPKPPWRERKDKYLEHLREADRSVSLVAAADKLHNARTTLTDLRTHGEVVWSRFRVGRGESLWFYRSCVGALREAGTAPLAIVDELELTVEALERQGT